MEATNAFFYLLLIWNIINCWVQRRNWTEFDKKEAGTLILCVNYSKLKNSIDITLETMNGQLHMIIGTSIVVSYKSENDMRSSINFHYSAL